MRLALAYRPKSLDEIYGQEILAPNSPLRRMISSGKIPHLFFYGPAGCGKTSLSKLIASEIDAVYYELNATTLKIEEVRAIFKTHHNSLQKPLIFIDEVHRLSKTQQEVLLPYMESFAGIIIGASTENPYYTLTAGIRSRSYLFELHSLKNSDMRNLAIKVCQNEQIEIDDEALNYLVDSSGGDARAMLNLLEGASSANTKDDTDKKVDYKTLKFLRPFAVQSGSSEATTHYDLTSAMIKSIRGSDIDASIYYLARLIEGGESAAFIVRRLAIIASEDIGNANPNAITIASSAMNIVEHIGYPEAKITLSQLVIYLASSPKSNSAYMAINDALQSVRDGNIMDIPAPIKPNASSYLYPHSYGGRCEQKYMSKKMKFYTSSKVGFEKTLDEWHSKITKKS